MIYIYIICLTANMTSIENMNAPQSKRSVIKTALGLLQLFPQIEDVMVQPLRESRDRYEELKQIDDAMNEVCVYVE